MPRTADWFANLSKKAQTEYLKAHPNSKYAKGSTTRKKFTKENLATMQKTPRKKFTKENLATMKRDITSAEAKRIKEHEAKRATDKKKVVAKTPSAKTASMSKTMAKAIAQRKARIKSGATSLLKSATASLAEARIKVKEAKTAKAKETAQKRVDSIKAKIAKLKAAAK